MTSATAMIPIDLLIPAEEQRGLALLRQLLRLDLGAGGHIRLGGDELEVTGGELGAAQSGGDAVAGQSLELSDLVGLHLPLLALLHDRTGQGVFALLLQGQGQTEEFVLADAVAGQDIRHFGLTAGDGTGLIQGNDLHLTGSLQGGGCLEEDAVLGAHAVAHHDSHGGSKAQSAGAADNQDGDTTGQCIAEGLPQQQPHHDGDDGNGNNSRYENAGNLIRHLGDRSLGSRRVTDHLDDLGEGGILAYAGGPGT